MLLGGATTLTGKKTPRIHKNLQQVIKYKYFLTKGREQTMQLYWCMRHFASFVWEYAQHYYTKWSLYWNRKSVQKIMANYVNWLAYE